MKRHCIKASTFGCMGHCKNGPLSQKCLEPRTKWRHHTDIYPATLCNLNLLVKGPATKSGRKEAGICTSIQFCWHCIKQLEWNQPKRKQNWTYWTTSTEIKNSCLQDSGGKNMAWKWSLLVCGWLSPIRFLSGRRFTAVRNFSPNPPSHVHKVKFYLESPGLFHDASSLFLLVKFQWTRTTWLLIKLLVLKGLLVWQCRKHGLQQMTKAWFTKRMYPLVLGFVYLPCVWQ